MKVDGRVIAEKIYDELKLKVVSLQGKGISPKLAVIMVGENTGSLTYIKQKQKFAEYIGAEVQVFRYKTDVKEQIILNAIGELNKDNLVQGIIVQLPLPDHMHEETIVRAVNPKKDIDGFHKNSPFTVPIVKAVIRVLEEIQKIDVPSEEFLIWLKTKQIVVIGKGKTAGGPLISYLQKQKVSCVVIDQKTNNPEKIMREADIILSAVGKSNVVKSTNIKKGVILIGVGLDRGEDKKLHGDYVEKEIEPIASFYTPTPGGIGPVNVACLLQNLVIAAKNQTDKNN